MAKVGARLYKIIGAFLGPYECELGGTLHWHLYTLGKGKNSRASVEARANQNRRGKERKKRKKQRDWLAAQVKSPQEPGPLGCILGF